MNSTVMSKPLSATKKERPILFKGDMVRAIMEDRKTVTRRVVTEKQMQKCPGIDYPQAELLRQGPYGKLGDILWVRETWCDDDWKFWYRADADETGAVPYEVNGVGFGGGVGHFKPDKWRPSIFMPRDACRLKLLITDVRVERLQNISEEQSLAEGIIEIQDGPETLYIKSLTSGHETRYPTAKGAFKSLWDDINKKRGYGWDKNPWLWVVEFQRMGASHA